MSWLCVHVRQVVQHGTVAAYLRGCGAASVTAVLGAHAVVLSAVRPPCLLPPLRPHGPVHRKAGGDAASRVVNSVAQRGAAWRGIACTPIRAEADNEEQAINWSGSFDGKLKMLMMEAAALERELCENPAPDRQAAIGEPPTLHVRLVLGCGVLGSAQCLSKSVLCVAGKTLARSARARALGGKLLGLYVELKGLQEVAEDFKEDSGINPCLPPRLAAYRSCHMYLLYVQLC